MRERSYSGVVGDQRSEAAEEIRAQGAWTPWYPTASGFEDERRAERGKDEAGVDGGGEEAEAEEDHLCGYRARGRSLEEPRRDVGLVVDTKIFALFLPALL